MNSAHTPNCPSQTRVMFVQHPAQIESKKSRNAACVATSLLTYH
jgi:hypothetical protein